MNSLDATKSHCVAVVGSGYWGKNLVRNFHQLDALKLICDKKCSRLRSGSRQSSKADLLGVRMW